MVRQVTAIDFHAFIHDKDVAVVHFDADWDAAYRPTVRRKMEQAMRRLGDQVAFGEVDCDDQAALARSIPIVNVPTVAYFVRGRMVGMQIGTNEDVIRRATRLVFGESFEPDS